MHYHVMVNDIRGRPRAHGFAAPTQRAAEFLAGRIRVSFADGRASWSLGRIGSIRVGLPCNCKEGSVEIPKGYERPHSKKDATAEAEAAEASIEADNEPV